MSVLRCDGCGQFAAHLVDVPCNPPEGGFDRALCPRCHMGAPDGGDGRPLLFLDVDGPLNPFRLIDRRDTVPAPSEGGFAYQKHHLYPRGFPDGLPVLLSPGLGEALVALSAHVDLAWATTWEDEANSIVAPLVGLPQLPVVFWPPSPREWVLFPRHRGSWKTKHLLAWVDEWHPGRRWAWVDDEINRSDRALVADHYGGEVDGRALLLRIEPRLGLRAADLDAIAAWAAGAPDTRPVAGFV